MAETPIKLFLFEDVLPPWLLLSLFSVIMSMWLKESWRRRSKIQPPTCRGTTHLFSEGVGQEKNQHLTQPAREPLQSLHQAHLNHLSLLLDMSIQPEQVDRQG